MPNINEEILFKDDKGNLKVLRGSEIEDWQEKGGAVAVSPTPISQKAATPFVSPAPLPRMGGSNYDDVISKIINESGVQLPDKLLMNRFRNIILMRLKEVRDDIETGEVLKRATNIGGMAFNENQAEAVIKAIKNKSHLSEQQTRGLIKEQLEEVERGLEERFKPSSPAISPIAKSPEEPEKIDKLEEPIKKTDILEAVVKPSAKTEKPVVIKKPVFQKPPPIAPKPKPLEFKPIAEKQEEKIEKPITPIEVEEKKVPPPAIKPEPIPKVVEVKPVLKPKPAPPPTLKEEPLEQEPVRIKPSLVGPVEELRLLTLSDFRKLSSDPEEAAKKIYDKIELLQEESFGKKILGIKAWRESEVFKLYTQIGTECMQPKASIEEVINKRKSVGKPYLSLEEFEAIMDLSQKLRF